MHLHKNIDVYLITVSLRFEHKISDTKVSTTIWILNSLFSVFFLISFDWDYKFDPTAIICVWFDW